jgi:hypothetical protein
MRQVGLPHQRYRRLRRQVHDYIQRATMKKKLKPMSPYEARIHKDICSLQSDNYNTAEGWILIDGDQITLAKQRAGEESKGSVTLSRAAFKRMIDWYLRPQDRSSDNGPEQP